jgi:hypothetical protein
MLLIPRASRRGDRLRRAEPCGLMLRWSVGDARQQGAWITDPAIAKPQELPLSTQPPQEPPPLATAPARGLSTRDIEALFADEHGGRTPRVLCGRKTGAMHVQII